MATMKVELFHIGIKIFDLQVPIDVTSMKEHLQENGFNLSIEPLPIIKTQNLASKEGVFVDIDEEKSIINARGVDIEKVINTFLQIIELLKRISIDINKTEYLSEFVLTTVVDSNSDEDVSEFLRKLYDKKKIENIDKILDSEFSPVTTKLVSNKEKEVETITIEPYVRDSKKFWFRFNYKVLQRLDEMIPKIKKMDDRINNLISAIGD